MTLKRILKFINWKLLLLIFILILSNGDIVLEHKMESDNIGKVDNIFDEIMVVYKTSGKEGLKSWMKKKKDCIGVELIKLWAKYGMFKESKEILETAFILAEEKGDDITLAEVYLNIGRNLFLNSDNKMDAVDYFKKALTIFIKLNDYIGQGTVYLDIGKIYNLYKDNTKALEIYNKALNCFENTVVSLGRGEAYQGKGDIYRDLHENAKALEMYDKAVPFLEKAGKVFELGSVHEGKGEIYYRMGIHSKALQMYDKALLLFENVGYIYGQGGVYCSKGEIHFKRKNYLKALKMYDKALYYFEKIGSIPSPFSQGYVYYNKGEIFFKMGNNSKALETYDKALHFFEKNRYKLGKAFVYERKGGIYLKMKNKSKAIEMEDKSLQIYEKEGDILGQIFSYNKKGKIYHGMGKNSKAIETYKNVLNLYDDVDYPISKGDVWFSIGNIYHQIGNDSKAIEIYNKAMDFYEKTKEFQGLGNVNGMRGDIYAIRGELSRAIEMCKEAIDCFKKEDSLIGQGYAYQRMGYFYIRTGDISQSLKMHENALHCFKKSGDLGGLGNVHLGMGTLYSMIGADKRALNILRKASDFYQREEIPIGQVNVYLAEGEIYFGMKNYSNAIRIYRKALKICRKIDYPHGLGNAYIGMGHCYFYEGKNSKAMEMYDKSLENFNKVGDILGIGVIYRSKGDMYLHSGHYPKALQMYNKAYDLFTTSGDIEAQFYALYKKAAVKVYQGKNIEAIFLYENSIVKMERVRAYTNFSNLKKSFMNKVYEIYEEAADFMVKSGFYHKSFRCIESMKARGFLDQLSEGVVKLERGITPEFLQKRDNLVYDLSNLNKEMIFAAGKKDGKRLKKLKEQYRKVEREFEDLLVKIRLNNPLYNSVKYPEPITVIDIQQKVLNENELLIRYFIARGKVYAFLISKKDFQVVELPATESEINKMVEEYLEPFKQKLYLKKRNKPIIKRWMIKHGKTLYQSIFKPFESEFKGKREIIIVPDGKLALIPFESYVIDDTNTDNPVYLLEKYRIKYVQSASTLAILRKLYRRDSKTNHFIGFGDPVYDYDSFKNGKLEKGQLFPSKGDTIKEIHRGKYAREGGIMDRLQDSGREVEAIARLFNRPDQKSVIYLRERATEENARAADMKEYDYIHFSSHGILGDGFQSLVLSQVPGSKEDGYLTLNELMNCNYHAKLVVLSACQTGSGKMERAEGVTGLTRAVMYAGTPCAVVSLWNVSEMGTKELMVKFYTNMLEKGMKKEEALRQAKLEMIKGEKYSSPYFWSAFVMYGE